MPFRFLYRDLLWLIALATVCIVSTYWQARMVRLMQRQAEHVKRLERLLDKADEMTAVLQAHVEEMRAER